MFFFVPILPMVLVDTRQSPGAPVDTTTAVDKQLTNDSPDKWAGCHCRVINVIIVITPRLGLGREVPGKFLIISRLFHCW